MNNSPENWVEKQLADSLSEGKAPTISHSVVKGIAIFPQRAGNACSLSFSDCIIGGCDFDITKPRFNIWFEGCKLSLGKFWSHSANLKVANSTLDFNYCGYLKSFEFRYSSFSGTKFDSCGETLGEGIARDSHFDCVTFSSFNIKILEFSSFRNGCFEKCSFSLIDGCTFYMTEFYKCDFSKCTFNEVMMYFENKETLDNFLECAKGASGTIHTNFGSIALRP